MKLIEYISYLAIPLMIIYIIIYSIKNGKDTYSTFIVGAKEGMNVIIKIFPTMLAIFVAINLFQVTGAMNIFIKVISPVTKIVEIPNEVVPIGIMRSVSGGGSVGLLSDILDKYGPDSSIGKIASTILGSTDTSLYIIAIYLSAVGIKKSNGVVKIALFCDLIALCVAVWIWKFI